MKKARYTLAFLIAFLHCIFALHFCIAFGIAFGIAFVDKLSGALHHSHIVFCVRFCRIIIVFVAFWLSLRSPFLRFEKIVKISRCLWALR